MGEPLDHGADFEEDEAELVDAVMHISDHQPSVGDEDSSDAGPSTVNVRQWEHDSQEVRNETTYLPAQFMISFTGSS